METRAASPNTETVNETHEEISRGEAATVAVDGLQEVVASRRRDLWSGIVEGMRRDGHY